MIELQISMFTVFLKNILDVSVIFESFSWCQFHDSINDPFFAIFFLTIVFKPLLQVLKQLTESIRIIGIARRADLTNDPTWSFDNKISRHYFFKELYHFVDNFLTESLVLLIVFLDKFQEIVENVLRQVFTA